MRRSFVLLSLIFICSCGYTSKSTLPANIKTIYVTPLKNNISYTTEGRRSLYIPLLEVDARKEIINRFQFDGNLRIAEQDRADLVLKGELTNFERIGLRFDDNDDVQEYRIQISVDFQLYNSRNDVVDWEENGFTGEAEYFLSGPLAKSEEAAVNDAIRDLARRIVERTIENW